jgi:glycosyltransferase involved in cell wall biosynthesis
VSPHTHAKRALDERSSARAGQQLRRASPKPAVSIVLPTFNRLRFLRPTIESVFAQTFADWELIIADDGSDEGTREYLRTLASEPRVKLIWLPHAGIPAVVRNAALAEARAEYVAFLDSDDLWAPSKLQRQFEVLRARVGSRWIYTAFSQVDASGQPLPEELHRRWVPHEGSVFERLVTGAVSVRTPSVLAARELIMRAGGFDETISSGEDYDLWLRMALDSDLAVIDEPLLHVRRHDENHSRNWHIAYHGRDHTLVKLQTRVDPARRTLLRSERVKNGLKLAEEYASLGETANVLRTLLSASGYSWPYPRWWLAAFKILVRRHVPRRLLDIYRAHVRGA